jgi:hypothetical protein
MDLSKDVIFGSVAGLALLIVGSLVIQSWRGPHEVTTLARKALVTEPVAAPEMAGSTAVVSTGSAPIAAPSETSSAPEAMSVGASDAAASASAPLEDSVENWR